MEHEKENILSKILTVAFLCFMIGIVAGAVWTFQTIPMWQLALVGMGVGIILAVFVFIVLTIKVLYQSWKEKRDSD